MRLPTPRGPLSAATFDRLGRAEPFSVDLDVVSRAGEAKEPLLDDDLQITLWALYELHYRGFDEVPACREWDTRVLALRGELESAFEADLRRRVPTPVHGPLELPTRLREVIESGEGPPLAAYLHREASRDQILQFLRQRSLYHRKESDPQAFVLPRIDGPAKVALAELLYDEFGAGRPDSLHSAMYAEALVGAGLDPSYGAYVDQTPAAAWPSTT